MENISFRSSPSRATATPPAPSPRPIPISDPNHYPTTFVQTDTSSFKQVVQFLTGSGESAKAVAAPPKPEPFGSRIFPVRVIPKIQKSSSKLYERRNLFRSFKINPVGPGLFQAKQEMLSPSILDFPSLALSPVTPLVPDLFNLIPFVNGINVEAEEKAIAEKEFYLHPSPVSTPTDSKPRLLPLFPETSPRVDGSLDSDS